MIQMLFLFPFYKTEAQRDLIYLGFTQKVVRPG